MTKVMRGGHEQYDSPAPTANGVRGGAVSCSKVSEDNSTSLMLLTTISEGVTYSIAVMNISKLKEDQVSRLWHWRLMHRSVEIPVDMTRKKRAAGISCSKVINEDCATCEHAHMKVQTFKRVGKDNPAYGIREALEPWERAHSDGYGGQDSMGVKSYDGAIGGFVFVCVATSARKCYLYSSKDQYPVILNRFMIWLDLQKRRCRLIICDTDAVLIS